MSHPVMTYDLAMAIGKDAANRRMRKAGRTTWNLADYNESVRAFYRCLGTTAAKFHAELEPDHAEAPAL